jgi:hypothetical protein
MLYKKIYNIFNLIYIKKKIRIVCESVVLSLTVSLVSSKICPFDF